jgi:hypothetical protein
VRRQFGKQSFADIQEHEGALRWVPLYVLACYSGNLLALAIVLTIDVKLFPTEGKRARLQSARDKDVGADLRILPLKARIGTAWGCT